MRLVAIVAEDPGVHPLVFIGVQALDTAGSGAVVSVEVVSPTAQGPRRRVVRIRLAD